MTRIRLLAKPVFGILFKNRGKILIHGKDFDLAGGVVFVMAHVFVGTGVHSNAVCSTSVALEH